LTVGRGNAAHRGRITNTGVTFDGWYPSFMTPSSLAAVYQPGQIGNTGQVFFMQGCNSAGSGRSFVSRTFTITTGP
jgi:hypothetical protein